MQRGYCDVFKGFVMMGMDSVDLTQKKERKEGESQDKTSIFMFFSRLAAMLIQGQQCQYIGQSAALAGTGQ